MYTKGLITTEGSYLVKVDDSRVITNIWHIILTSPFLNMKGGTPLTISNNYKNIH